jgi:prepilin-type N-terminal cleavage/methylation domain-containing protein
MKTKKTRFTGFTLVELIVVIAIVAILATVSIVGFNQYINRARLSNDTTDAKNMTNILQAYMIQENLEDIEADEIRAIVNIDNDYSFVPQSKGNSFWYDVETKTISVKPDYESASEEEFVLNRPTYPDGYSALLSQGENERSNHVHLGNDGTMDPGSKLEEVINGYLLLDTGGSIVSEAISTIRNLRILDEFSTNKALLEEYSLSEHVEQFNPDKTLFINDYYSLTRVGSVGDGLNPLEHIIFSDFIEVFPSGALNNLKEDNLPETITVPRSVVYIERDAFILSYEEYSELEGINIYVRRPAGVEVVLKSNSIDIEVGAFHKDDMTNAELKSKETDISLFDINFSIEFRSPTTYFYNEGSGAGDPNTYVGKRLTSNSTGEVTVDSFVNAEWVESVSEETTCRNYDYTGSREGYFCKIDDSTSDYDGYWMVIMQGGDVEFFVHTTKVNYAGPENSTGMWLLLMEYTKTHEYYLGNQYIGSASLSGSELIYYAEELNWFYWNDKCDDSSNHGTPLCHYQYVPNSSMGAGSAFTLTDEHRVTSPIVEYTYTGDINETNYPTIVDDLYDADVQYSFIDQNINTFLKDGDNPLLVLYGASLTYREFNGITIVEAKGYDKSGKLIARGTVRFIRTLSNYVALPVDTD